MSSAGAEGGSVAAALEEKAERAEALARERESAREPLLFAAGLYRAQARAAASLEALHVAEPWSGDLQRDAGRLLEAVGAVVDYAARAGPAALAAEAAAREKEPPAAAREHLLAYWSGEEPDDYLSRACLRPWAEALARLGVRPRRAAPSPRPACHCPFCGGQAWVASRRGEEPNSQGAARYLHCALCARAWQVSRILCTACGETHPEKLPIFQVDAHPEARIEACETCRRYVKSIDLTLDARRLPEVDDLSSLALDLWAAEQGYSRLEPGLAGL